jgi:CRP-like cAMP-binding protein
MINETLLLEFGARKLHIKKGEIIFNEGDTPKYYYQIQEGEVKMNNFNDEGKEFIQGLFSVGRCFGEPPLFIDKPYPASAVATVDTDLYLLSKEAFFKLLHANPDVNLAMSINLSQRLYYKSIMASEISSQDAEHRIITLIDYFKEIVGMKPSDKYKVTLTRQQIADLTGLRVETVIRAIKSLEKKGSLTIAARKIYR